jgi:hypothetical protein
MSRSGGFLQAGHFRREAKLMLAAAVGVPVLLAIAGAFVAPFLVEYLAVDRCLDAGGQFNYGQGVCESSSATESGVSRGER